MYLLALWITWLVIAAFVLRWVVGGIIDCFKHGTKASLFSWMGFVVGIVIFLIIAACVN